MRGPLLAAGALAAASLGLLAWRPLPPDVRGPQGDAPLWARPALALEDWFDAREGLGAPCRDRRLVRRAIGGVLTLELPRCFTLRRLPDGVVRLADEGLAPLAAALLVARRAAQPARAARATRATPLGEQITWWRDAGLYRVALSVVVPGRLAYSPKARRHVAALEAVAASLAATAPAPR